MAGPSRVVSLPLALLSVVLLGSAGLLAVQPSSTAADTTTGSEVTVSGTGAFASLKVTVGQTKNLVNQAVDVTWSGARTTAPGTGFGVNFLQMMQCWGDDADGPTREQCQFGGLAATDQRGGTFVSTRQLNYGSLVDPKEKLPAGSAGDQVFAPFTSVTGVTTSGNFNEFYDANTTNEIAFARTRGDGRGSERFEVVTVRESEGLGCGQPVTTGGVTKPRSCWLVIVPRGETEVDGTALPASGSENLNSSPLSQSNWDNRLVVKLEFAPVGDVCPIGSAERRTYGSEDVSEAVLRWQPALCEDGGAVYGFSRVADSVADRQMRSADPGLAFVTKPFERPLASGARLTYAPVAISGLTLAFSLDRRAGPSDSAAEQARNGERITSLKLTPRLVAKLLTQSYRLGVNGTIEYLGKNPENMLVDPDFLRFNPEFADLTFPRGIPEVFVPSGLSEANSRLWEYVTSDQEARDFLAGAADPWGMKVSPFYQGLDLPRRDFPKLDPYCQEFPPDLSLPPAQRQPPLCTLDVHPYTGDLQETARAVARGDTLSRTTWDKLSDPPAYKRTGLLRRGENALMGFADTASAERYGLAVASLRNAAGKFVDPSTSSLLAAAAQAPLIAPGVRVPSVTASDPKAYPLTVITYAATPASTLTQAAARDYAALVRYAAGKGQEPGFDPGQLPSGYAPLPAAMRAQARSAATAIENRAGAPEPSSSPTPNPTKGSGSGNGSSGSSGSGSDVSGGGTQPEPAPTSSVPTPSTSPSAAVVPSALPSTRLVATAPTPANAAGAAKYALLAALLLGGLAAGAASVVPGLSGRLGR
jgi:hypothetical protein